MFIMMIEHKWQFIYMGNVYILQHVQKHHEIPCLEIYLLEFLRIEIYEMKENTFYANLTFRANGTEHIIDSRPSDAVALALNKKIPILVNKKLFRRELTPDEIKEYEDICKTVKF